MNGFLLFSHGSLLCGAGAALGRHAEALRARLRAPVEIGYLNYSEPTFESGVAALAGAGAQKVIIVPYFLAPGYFVTHSLPEKLAEARRSYPHLVFAIADVLGSDDRLVDALIESAEASKADPEEWRSIFVDAAQCRNRPDCPLYGGRRCPAFARSPMAA